MRAVNIAERSQRDIFTLLKADFTRVFFSWPFYTAIIGVALLNLLSISDELQYMVFTVHDTPTVFYLYYIHDAFGPPIIIFLCALPFASSFCTDWNNRYTRYCIIRSSARAYGRSKVIVTAVTGFLAIFIGTGLLYGILGIFLPWYDAGSLKMNAPFLSVLSGAGPLPYFAASIFFDALGYAFLAVFALWISTRITNIFVVMSSPIILYYGWQYLSGAAELPEIVRFQHVMNRSFLQSKIASDGLSVLFAAVYFFILILLFGTLFSAGVKRRMKNV